MAWSQEEVIFPTHAVPAAGPHPPGTERISMRAKSGDTLHGIHISPAGGRPSATLVVGFGGNAWNGEDVGSYLHELYPDVHVVAFHYRGYRPSTGSPSAEALVEDAPLALGAAIERVKPERVVAVGFSIGSAVAASLAKTGEIDGLVLVTPFDSLRAVAADIYPWLPIGLLFRHELNTTAFLGDAQVPVAILAGGRDEIVPSGRTDALRNAVPKLVYDRTIDGAGHNDIYARPDFRAAMAEALAAVTGSE